MHPYTLMAIAWLGSAAWISFVIFSNRKAHPRALFFLFFVEMWERFSYYGMRALLVLYMTNGILEYSNEHAYGVYGAYGSMVYATPLIGGLLAERFMGYRKAIMWGAFLMMLGHFLMAFEYEYIFFTALAMLILGNGFFKPNISAMIGKFYAKSDPRRDGAFTIFYMGINIGAFLAGLTCGVVGEIEGWHWGFSLAGIGMFAGLLIFWWAQRSGALEDKGYEPHKSEEQEVADDVAPVYEVKEDGVAPKLAGVNVNIIIYVVSFLTVPLLWFLLNQHGILTYGLGAIGFGMIGYLFAISFQYEKVQRERIWVVILLFLFAVIFWTFFELAGSALTVFTDNNVAKTGFLTTTMFQSANPLFIMIFAPVFSWIWIQLSKRNAEPSAPIKFGIGLILLGLGFLVLKLGEGSAQAGMIPAIFMLLLYLLHTLGELSLSPVGLSLVTKLSPMKIVGFVMGFWLLSSSMAHILGIQIAQMTNVDMSVMLQEEERLERFKSSMTENEFLREKFIEHKEVYKAFVSEADDDAMDKYKADQFLESNELLTEEELEAGHEVNEFLYSDFFLNVLNKASDDTKYYKATVRDEEIMKATKRSTNPVYIKKKTNEATSSFLTTDKSLVVEEGEDPKQFSPDDIAKMINESPNAIVNTTVAQDTLVICLGVFAQLGLFAIGAGIFLLIAALFVNKWMHGIK